MYKRNILFKKEKKKRERRRKITRCLKSQRKKKKELSFFCLKIESKYFFLIKLDHFLKMVEDHVQIVFQVVALIDLIS
jgi:serine/threonine protein phosphatase PrpC